MKEVLMKNLSSSQIKSVGYDIYEEELYVEFTNGKVYRYFDVLESTYNNFLAAPSPGKFFFSQIKNIFEYEAMKGEVVDGQFIPEED